MSESSTKIKEIYILNKRKCHVQKFKFGKHYDESISQIYEIIQYLNRSFATNFNRMIGDFIRGNSGKLHLFNINAYRVESPLSELRMKVKITHRGSFLSKELNQGLPGFDYLDEDQHEPNLTPNAQFFFCKYCKLETQTSPQTHSLSLKMILKLDKFLIEKGINMAPHLRFIESRLSALKSLQNDFRGHFFFRVCEMCFSLHKEMLKLKSIQKEFAQIVGINDCDLDPGFLTSLAKKKREELMSNNKVEKEEVPNLHLESDRPKKIFNFFMFVEFLDNLPKKLRFSRLQTLSLKFHFLEREYSIPFEWVCHSTEKKTLSIVQNNLIKTAKYLMSTNFNRMAERKHSYKSFQSKTSWNKLRESTSNILKLFGKERQSEQHLSNPLYRKRQEKNIAKEIINKANQNRTRFRSSGIILRTKADSPSKSASRSRRKTLFNSKGLKVSVKKPSKASKISPRIEVLDDQLRLFDFVSDPMSPKEATEENQEKSMKSFKEIKWRSNKLFSSRLSNVKEKDGRSTVLFIPFYKTRLWRLVCRSKADLSIILEEEKMFKIYLYEGDNPLGHFEFNLEMLLDPRKMCDSQEKFLTGASPEDSLNFRLKTSFLVQETPSDQYYENQWLVRKSLVRLSSKIQMVEPKNPFLGTLTPEMLTLLSSTCVYDYQEMSFPFPKVLRGQDIVEELFEYAKKLGPKITPKIDIFSTGKTRFSVHDLKKKPQLSTIRKSKYKKRVHTAIDGKWSRSNSRRSCRSPENVTSQADNTPVLKSSTNSKLIQSEDLRTRGTSVKKKQKEKKLLGGFKSDKKQKIIFKENNKFYKNSFRDKSKHSKRSLKNAPYLKNQNYLEKHYLFSKNEKINNMGKVFESQREKCFLGLPKNLYGSQYYRFQTEYQIMKNNILSSDQILQKKGNQLY